MSLIDLAGLKLPGALPLPESEAEILAALDGIGYLLMPFNGLPVILAVTTAKISAGACERITETRLEVMQKALRAAGFKPGETVDLSRLAGMSDPNAPGNEPKPATAPKPNAETDDDENEPFDEEDVVDAADPFAGEEDDPEDAADELPFESPEERDEKLLRAAEAMKENSRLILDAEVDAVLPSVLAWGIAGHGWGLPGRGEAPTRDDVAGDSFLGRSLRGALLDGFLRPIMRGLPTQAAFRPEHLFPQEKAKESASNPQE